MKIFNTFKCSCQNSSNSSCQFWNDKSIPLQILYHSSFSWHTSPLWILRWYFFYFRLDFDEIKIPVLRLSVPLVKICHIPHVIFETSSQFFFKSFITLHSYERWLLCTFLGQTLILCTFFIVIILNIFVCSYCCKLFVIFFLLTSSSDA